MLVNAFKDMSLKDRPADTFPHQMLKFSEQREHCLMSTLQLLGIFYYSKNNPEKKKEVIKGIFDTVGIYVGFTKWEDFLSLKDSTE